MVHKKMMAHKKKKSWKELPPLAKFGTVVAGAVQLTLLVVAQRDISRRPAEQIRGSKALWRVVTLFNFIGPGSYFVFGRKKVPATR
jgi:Phospholipase_D-nuclease N-terminal